MWADSANDSMATDADWGLRNISFENVTVRSLALICQEMNHFQVFSPQKTTQSLNNICLT